MILREVRAGNEEKSDAVVIVSPGSGKREINIEKLPHPRFRESILSIVNRILDEEGIDNICVNIQDFGALEFAIVGRLRAALREAEKEA